MPCSRTRSPLGALACAFPLPPQSYAVCTQHPLGSVVLLGLGFCPESEGPLDQDGTGAVGHGAVILGYLGLTVLPPSYRRGGRGGVGVPLCRRPCPPFLCLVLPGSRKGDP